MMQEVEEPLLPNAQDGANALLVDKSLLNNARDGDSTHSEVSINQDPSPPSPDVEVISHRPMSSCRVVKNMCILCFSMFMYFLGFMALSNLQSTMNSAKGVGTESQATIYVASMLSALLLPELVVKSIGCRLTLIASVSFSIPYIVANFSPSLAALIPTAALLGLSAGPLTTSQMIYVNELARRYHKGSSTELLEVVVARFFGFNSLAQESTQIVGNLISYYVLSPNLAPIVNQTTNSLPCGVNFIIYDLNGTNATNPNLLPVDDYQRTVLVTIFTACGVISVATMFFFMDNLGNDVDKDARVKAKCSSLTTRLIASLQQARKVDQLLLIPLSVYCGMITAFYASDFTEAFIACSWGVHHVGFVTICFGACGAAMAILVGPLVKYISQMSVIIMAAVINVVTCALLFVWEPTPNAPVIYFIFAGVWGMTDAIWWSQIAALYGLMFPNDREAAFSNFFFWSFLGYFLSYSYANYFTVAVKINIMLVFLVVGITLYTIGQVKIKCFSNRSAYVEIDETE